MVQPLQESRKPAFGFKVTGPLTAEDVTEISAQIEQAIAVYRTPIGLLADITEMHGASWLARWDQMRFLQHHAGQIARMAVVCNDEWQQISEMLLVATTFLQAETIYCDPAHIQHGWRWVRMNPIDETLPVRVMYPGKGLFKDYTPEYVGI